MLYFKYLFHNLEDLSPNEGLVYSELIFHSLTSNPGYKTGKLLYIDAAKEELHNYRELQWTEEIDYYPMDYAKIMKHTELTFPTVKKIIKNLQNKNLIDVHHIKCSWDLLNEGYMKIPYNTNLKGRELLFYALLVDRAYKHERTVDTWAYKLAELCGIKKESVGYVYKIICHLKQLNLLERLKDGKLRIIKPKQPDEETS